MSPNSSSLDFYASLYVSFKNKSVPTQDVTNSVNLPSFYFKQYISYARLTLGIKLRFPEIFSTPFTVGRLQLKCDCTRWRTGGELKGKLANGVGIRYPSHYLGTWYIQHYYRCCAHLVRFAERRNVISSRVPSHFIWPLKTRPLL